MKISCDIIKDLLPLYHEEVCYEQSKKLVEEHLNDCQSCKAYLEEMKENKLDERIKKERENVIGNHIQKVKKHSLVQGLSIAMIISIIPPFVVNLAIARTLSWFFIVLTGVMLFGTTTLIPLIIEKNKGFWTLIGSTVSLLLLLFTISVFTGGRWFQIAATSVLLTVGCILLFTKLFQKK